MADRPYKNIVIVAIDEKSLKEQGRWPWNRKTIAKLIDKLFTQYKAKVVGLDVVFAEKDES
jgi:adenylate cyclase